MKKITKEKNISVYNQDIKKLGRYEYTGEDRYSAITAGRKQSEEILRSIKSLRLKKPYKILDVGSGDGTYTFELYEKLNPKLIVGFDFSKGGVEIARKRVKKKDARKIKFINSSIYNVDKKIRENFDVAVIRGVLHHLYYPQRGIKAVCKLSDVIVVAEPNGYSPLMKIMEKISPYHRRHEEKSYFPPTLNNWFKKNGFRIKKQYFFGPVPFFFPEMPARIIKKIEPFIENVPYVNRIYCASNLIIYEKKQE